MTASDALEELEAVIRRTLAKYTRSLSVNDDVEAILTAAERYRHAPEPFTRAVMHLAGVEGAITACQYASWQDPERVAVTGNPVLISCGKCKRSRLYRDMAREAAA